MPTVRLELPLPRTWMLTVRALECSALLVLVGMLVDSWQAWRASGDYYPPVSADGLPVPATLMQRTVGFVLMGTYGAPAAVLAPALCVAAALAVLHLARPVDNAGVLRWEVLVAGSATALYCLAVVVLAVVAAFGNDPYAAQRLDGGGGYRGPSLLERTIGVGALPLAALVLLSAAALWWLRLPADTDDPEEGPEQAADPEAAPTARPAWRPLGAAERDQDDLLLDGVEVIEPVERLQSRDEGGTGSGYEDYLRRS